MGIVVAIGGGLVLRRVLFHGDAAPFIMELPAYRLPTPRNVLRNMWDKASDFVKRAFSVIFVATVIVWFLQSFTPRMEMTADVHSSMLGILAGWIAPLFAPLGFGSVEASTAIITGLMAKESVISTLAVLTGAPLNSEAMLLALRSVFPGIASVAAFLTFVLLYTPCVAALAAMRRELESTRWAVCAAIGQCCVAWGVAFVVYRLFLLLGVA